MTNRILADQVAYYRARAGEYDQWFFRHGRYDRGDAHRAEWLGEIDRIRKTLGAEIRDCHVLELACGTGLWTEQLARENRTVLAIDASPEVIAINQERVRASNVKYEVADIFAWQPATRFDAVFFAFWLSHVPPEQFEPFWNTVRGALKPGGRAFFVDSLLEQTSTATDHAPVDDSGVVRRKLNDGREFDIVKVFYEPQGLAERLTQLGWHARGSTKVEPCTSVRSSGRFFLFGSVSR